MAKGQAINILDNITEVNRASELESGFDFQDTVLERGVRQGGKLA